MANEIELSMLATDVYNIKDERVGFGRFEPLNKGIDNKETGLRLQTYVDHEAKEIVFAIGGTDELKDWPGPNKNFAFGGYNDQFKQAVNEAIKLYKNDDYEGYSFSTPGHSLGGGVAQVISHTFGWDGLSTDAPGASRVIASQGYLDHMKELGITPAGPGHFINFTERFSPVSHVPLAEHIGEVMQFNLVSDAGKWLQGGLLIVGGPLATGIGLLLAGNDVLDQHDKFNFPRYFMSELNPDEIGQYNYENGKWYEPAQEMADDLEEDDTPERVEVDADVAQSLDAKRELLLKVIEDQKTTPLLQLSNSHGIDDANNKPEKAFVAMGNRSSVSAVENKAEIEEPANDLASFAPS